MNQIMAAIGDMARRRMGEDRQRLDETLRDLKLVCFPELTHDRWLGLVSLGDTGQLKGAGGARLHLMRAGKSLAVALRQGMPEAADGLTVAAIAAIVRAAECLPEEPPAEEPATL